VSSAPVAFFASVFALHQNRYGVASRMAFALSTLEFLLVVGGLVVLFAY